jgi:hypothetical protein
MLMKFGKHYAIEGYPKQSHNQQYQHGRRMNLWGEALKGSEIIIITGFQKYATSVMFCVCMCRA